MNLMIQVFMINSNQQLLEEEAKVAEAVAS